MSAYMCSERELTILAAYAVKHVQAAIPYALRSEVDGSFEHARGGYNRTIGRVFAMLATENLASLVHRYGARLGEATSVAYAVRSAALKETVPALHLIKLCHHYAYQACEHPGWQDSDATKVVAAIEAHAVQELPGYDAAPWGAVVTLLILVALGIVVLCALPSLVELFMGLIGILVTLALGAAALAAALLILEWLVQ